MPYRVCGPPGNGRTPGPQPRVLRGNRQGGVQAVGTPSSRSSAGCAGSIWSAPGWPPKRKPLGPWNPSRPRPRPLPAATTSASIDPSDRARPDTATYVSNATLPRLALSTPATRYVVSAETWIVTLEPSRFLIVMLSAVVAVT